MSLVPAKSIGVGNREELPWRITQSALNGVLVFEPTAPDQQRTEDGCETCQWSQRVFDVLIGYPLRFVQDNHSHSHRNVLRGLHYQIERPQGKLIYVIRGSSYDVAVDIRSIYSRLPSTGILLCSEHLPGVMPGWEYVGRA